MEGLDIAETKLTPLIHFNFSTGVLDIKGRSIPENAAGLYEPVLDALANYKRQTKAHTTVNFALVYFNTSSSKCLLQLLTALSGLNKGFTKVRINWYYDTSDEDQLETANDLEAISGLEFNYIGIDPEV